MKTRRHAKRSARFTTASVFAPLLFGTLMLFYWRVVFGATTVAGTTSPLLPAATTALGGSSSLNAFGSTSAFATTSPFMQPATAVGATITPINAFGGNSSIVTATTPIVTTPAFPQSGLVLNNSLGGFAFTTANNGLVTAISPTTTPSGFPQTSTTLNPSLGGFVPTGGSTGLSAVNGGVSSATGVAASTGGGMVLPTIQIPSFNSISPNQNTAIGGNPSAIGSPPAAIATPASTVAPSGVPSRQPGAVISPVAAAMAAQASTAQPLGASTPSVPGGATAVNALGTGTGATAPESVPTGDAVVQMVVPSFGAVVPNSGNPMLAASVVAGQGTVTGVEFFLNGTDIGPGIPIAALTDDGTGAGLLEGTVFASQLPQLQPGNYLLTAVAVDDTGAFNASQPILIRVR